ncbi:hypothetical protein VII00023_19494 [Vibrio ichthyoenteri ATCC 700023]|uniref:Uncharacterized protein n=1 Tax=Vibrio ichthyoenteri ATCC 700023 TaxID=870968 RepID=F9S3C9_9VIBR|nr:hypothetical protein [Vibrio ichthyoenteri]EGU38153.1 hypothetical protein VII00023_19494 [Vibrio ichthyoenteri ATCC 700023]
MHAPDLTLLKPQGVFNMVNGHEWKMNSSVTLGSVALVFNSIIKSGIEP